MSDEADEPRPRRRATWIATVLIVVLLLYPLSSGPVFVLAYRYSNLESRYAILAFYEPLKLSARKSGTTEKYFAYLKWWFELTETPPPFSLLFDVD